MSKLPTIKKFGEYIVESGLGRGSSGLVYLGRHEKLQRKVAIKVFQPSHLQDTRANFRFQREIQAISLLEHPNIVQCIDHGTTNENHHYLVMEYLEGKNIGDLHRDIPIFPETTIAIIGLSLSSALTHAHVAGIVHRDLKPENVFISGQRVVLADFGIAKGFKANGFMGQDAATPTEIVGTPGFMAPEQLRQAQLSAQTDIFALGALLYFISTGKLAYPGTSPYALMQAMRETRPVPITEYRPEFSHEFSKLIQDCLSYNESMRPSSMSTIHETLRIQLSKLDYPDWGPLLEQFVENPHRFKDNDRYKRIASTKILLRNKLAQGELIGVDAIRNQLRALAPDDPDAVAFSQGFQTRLENIHDIEAPLERNFAFKSLFLIAFIALVALASGIWLNQSPSSSLAIPTLVPTKTATTLNAPAHTNVFVDGRAIGTAPTFLPLHLEKGKHHIEASHPKLRTLSSEVEILTANPHKVTIDFKKRRITVMEEP
ncbi:MAG: serine/threonine-protein kinase [Myxococcota bacterium]|nr:serine/threonine-protein kinase [Myxococcota bacterium]